jgi:hypothetical protein
VGASAARQSLTTINFPALIHAPEKVKLEFPQFKAVESNAELLKLIKGVMGWPVRPV